MLRCFEHTSHHVFFITLLCSDAIDAYDNHIAKIKGKNTKLSELNRPMKFPWLFEKSDSSEGEGRSGEDDSKRRKGRNNEFATKTSTKSKRKIPPEVENISVSSEPKQRAKKKRNIYTYTCCHEEDQRRTSRTNLPTASKTASLQTEDCSGGDLAGEAAILNTKEGLLGTRVCQNVIVC